MLEDILGSRTKVNILRELSRDPKRDYTVQDLASSIGAPYGSVHPAVMDLVGSRVLRSRKAGRSLLVQFNGSHILSKNIMELFRMEVKGHLDIAKEFARAIDKEHIKNILLFGSTARGDHGAPGDIDIIIVHDGRLDTGPCKIIEEEVLEGFGVIISPIFMTPKDVRKRIKGFDGFMLRVRDECIVLYGDDRWLRAL